MAEPSCAIELVTPETAKEWLGKNHKNRKLNDPQVRHLVGVILRGEWMSDCTDAIGLDEDGGVVNGQHRLSAIVAADQAVECLVLRNVRPQVIAVIDQGTNRTLTQLLEMQGTYIEGQAGTVAGAVEWLYKMQNHTEREQPRELKPTIPQLLELLHQHPNLHLSIDAATPVSGVIKSRLSKAILTAYHYAMSEADNELADDFFDQLATGAGLSDSSPVYVLRERLLAEVAKQQKDKEPTWVLIFWLVRAWEATRRGEATNSKLLNKFRRTGSKAEPVPTVSGVSWLADEVEEAEAA